MPARAVLLTLAILLVTLPAGFSHELPLSYVDLHLASGVIEVTVESSAKNFARELPGVEEASFLDSVALEQLRNRLLRTVATGLTITSGGDTLSPTLLEVQPAAAQRNLRLRLEFLRPNGGTIHLHCHLFAADARHRTFLNIDEGVALRYQGIFDRAHTDISYAPGESEGTLTVVRQFLLEGVHHIFIGPDHILFIIGLLLLGGSIGRLLRIVTAFT
ncbi:MAG: HupE/UreJ family protein, partial [Chthoniobacterales bacterium]|nr:HupE/UreJ family protein [Chthoniobacterales bacterium]